MEVAVISEKGISLEMEDAHFLDLNFANKGWTFGGVYDGHGGRFAAKYASERVHQIFLERILSGVSPQEAFIETYEAISEDLKTQDSGTTAVNFLIKDRDLFTANAGDARAILITNEGFHQLTVDHRLDNLAERQRVKKMGGDIRYPYACRGYQGLMPTRTIGDQYFKSIGIIATPSVSEYKISEKDLILLVACDGLFDVMSNEEAAGLARKFPEPEPLLEVLKNEVLINRSGTDNLTIIAASLQAS
ncbi:MAG: protein serine/threonine phosphatase 2C family protein [Desulfobacterales bacterium]|nr:protein serine/threonine phosphatase 2C family protein [Desulfobacterales bacterium]